MPQPSLSDIWNRAAKLTRRVFHQEVCCCPLLFTMPAPRRGLSTSLTLDLQAQTTMDFLDSISRFLRKRKVRTMDEIDTMNEQDTKYKMSVVNRYVQSLCGLYSRVARQLSVDRSYVSRVARGERHSDAVENAISTEFDRIMNKNSNGEQTA
jgi:hypothetical protein